MAVAQQPGNVRDIAQLVGERRRARLYLQFHGGEGNTGGRRESRLWPFVCGRSSQEKQAGKPAAGIKELAGASPSRIQQGPV